MPLLYFGGMGAMLAAIWLWQNATGNGATPRDTAHPGEAGQRKKEQGGPAGPPDQAGADNSGPSYSYGMGEQPGPSMSSPLGGTTDQAVLAFTAPTVQTLAGAGFQRPAVQTTYYGGPARATIAASAPSSTPYGVGASLPSYPSSSTGASTFTTKAA